MPGLGNTRGERRLLSFLFADLVDSTNLAEILDPEDLRDIYLQTRELAYIAVARHGGRIKDYFGDGVLAYFGYPTATERGAQAAVNAALEMVGAVANRRWPVGEHLGLEIKMRVGIHSGEVVVGDIGQEGGTHEPGAVVGAAPIVASRIQSLAGKNTVAISESTHRMVAGHFLVRSLGKTTLKGVAEPIAIYEVQGSTGARAQADWATSRGMRPLIGRASEFGRLRAEWRLALEGGHPCVCVLGEAGIGKSRLMAEFKATIRAERDGAVWEFQCSPYEVHTPFFAVRETVRGPVCGFTDGESVERRVAKMQDTLRRAKLDEPEDFWLLAELLDLPYAEAELNAALAPEARKRSIHRLLSKLFPALNPGRPALYEFNDAHWVDASTAEWLAAFRSLQLPSSLIVVTTRPGAPQVEGAEHVALGALASGDIEALARSAAGGKILPHEAIDHIARTCAGVPLFVEEMTAALLASGALEEHDRHFELKDWSAVRRIPLSLRDLLQSRLDHLNPLERDVMQVCAVVGTDVTAAIVARVLEDADASRAAAAFDRLAAAGFLSRTQEPGVYEIRHALIQNAAYETLLKATWTRFHVRVARMLEAGEMRGLRTAPERLAEHLTQAGHLDAAVPRWLESAQNSLRRSAQGEAIALARRGLDVLERAGFPTALRPQQVALATTLGMAFVTSKGFASPDAVSAFHEAENLLADVQDPEHRFPTIWGLCITHLARGQLDDALRHGDAMLAAGRAIPGSGFLIEALWTRGAILFWLGRLDEAEAHLVEAVAMYRPEHHRNAYIFGQNPGVAARVYLMQLRCFRLQSREALELARDSIEFARGLRHPHSIAWALAGASMVKLLLGDVEGTLASAPETIDYCMKQEHPFWRSAMMIMMGWATAQKGGTAQGLKMALDGFALYQMLGTMLISPVFCSLLSDCCVAAGADEEATKWAARARELVVQNNERLSHPGVLLVEAGLCARRGETDRAEALYREALVLAHGQGSLLREVQSAAMLANLLGASGRRAEVHEILAPYAQAIMSPDAPAFLRPLANLLSTFGGLPA